MTVIIQTFTEVAKSPILVPFIASQDSFSSCPQERFNICGVTPPQTDVIRHDRYNNYIYKLDHFSTSPLDVTTGTWLYISIWFIV